MKTDDKKIKKRVTIKDVATAADVSIATVSYVLNNTPGQSIGDDTRKKVLQFANILGYECNVMARYLATGKTNSVSAVIKDIPSVGAQYYLKLMTELSVLLNRQNYDLKITDYAEACERNSFCDGFITIALSESDFRAFADTKYVPVIAVDSVFDDFLFYRINDDYANMYVRSKRELGSCKIRLLTHALPEECLQKAREVFDGVDVIDDIGKLSDLGKNAAYATVSKLLYDSTKRFYSVAHVSASSAFKASSAADAIVKAIGRVCASPEEHDIRV